MKNQRIRSPIREISRMFERILWFFVKIMDLYHFNVILYDFIYSQVDLANHPEEPWENNKISKTSIKHNKIYENTPMLGPGSRDPGPWAHGGCFRIFYCVLLMFCWLYCSPKAPQDDKPNQPDNSQINLRNPKSTCLRRKSA